MCISFKNILTLAVITSDHRNKIRINKDVSKIVYDIRKNGAELAIVSCNKNAAMYGLSLTDKQALMQL